MGETARHWSQALTYPRDPVTGWPTEPWVGPGTEIKIFVDEILTREDDSFAGGRITLKRMKVFCNPSDGVAYQDMIIYGGEAFLVESVTTIEYLYAGAQYTRVMLVRFTDD